MEIDHCRQYGLEGGKNMRHQKYEAPKYEAPKYEAPKIRGAKIRGAGGEVGETCREGISWVVAKACVIR